MVPLLVIDPKREEAGTSLPGEATYIEEAKEDGHC
jgi:hypothetical protein